MPELCKFKQAHGHRLIVNKKQSVPVGLAISGQIPEVQPDEAHTEDEAASDPDTEVQEPEGETPVAVPSHASVPVSGNGQSAIPPQAGQGESTAGGSADAAMSSSLPLCILRDMHLLMQFLLKGLRSRPV